MVVKGRGDNCLSYANFPNLASLCGKAVFGRQGCLLLTKHRRVNVNGVAFNAIVYFDGGDELPGIMIRW